MLAPGAIATDFGGGGLKNSQEMQMFIAGQTALGRTGEADDIGGIIAALCTSEMGWDTNIVTPINNFYRYVLWTYRIYAVRIIA